MFINGTFFLKNGSSLSINCVTFLNSSGITATTLRNHSSISNSRFLDFKTRSFITRYFITIDYPPGNCPGPSHISINNCEISLRHSEGWGVLLTIARPNVHVFIAKLVITNSRGGGKRYYNLEIYFRAFTGNFIELSNITITNGSSSIYTHGLDIVVDGDLPYFDPLSCGPNATRQPHYLMEISNMTITKNSGGAGFYIRDYSQPETDCNVQYILMRDSVITENVRCDIASVGFIGNTR